LIIKEKIFKILFLPQSTQSIFSMLEIAGQERGVLVFGRIKYAPTNHKTALNTGNF